MEGKQPAKKAKKPNILFRLLALLVTAALVLGCTYRRSDRKSAVDG